jgi:hypothetical protein
VNCLQIRSPAPNERKEAKPRASQAKSFPYFYRNLKVELLDSCSHSFAKEEKEERECSFDLENSIRICTYGGN